MSEKGQRFMVNQGLLKVFELSHLINTLKKKKKGIIFIIDIKNKFDEIQYPLQT